MSSTAVDHDYNYYMPSTAQQRVISAIQIPPSILSLIGSSLIIYNIRKSTKRTPHRRIMLALSVSNLVSTIGWILQPFLVPQDLSDPWVYAIGNDASCIMLGAISQFGIISQPFYLGFLSLYFLMTVKFGVKQRDFETKFEPWIHSCILLLAVSTTVGGILLGFFRPNVASPGCWVNPALRETEESKGDADGPERLFALVFGAIPSVACLTVIFVSNVMLYTYVRKTVMEGQKKSLANEINMMKNMFHSSVASNTGSDTQHRRDEENDNRADGSRKYVASFNNTSLSDISVALSSDTNSHAKGRRGPKSSSNKQGTFVRQASFGSMSVLSTATTTNKSSMLTSSNKQWKRVRQVGRQAMLYVGAYLLTFTWTFVVDYYLLIGHHRQEEGSVDGDVLFTVMILQAIFGGSLGASLALIFFLPKVRQARIKYDCEPWWWVLQQAITGEAEKVERLSSIHFNFSSRNISTGRQKGDKRNWAHKKTIFATTGEEQSTLPTAEVPSEIAVDPSMQTSAMSRFIDDMIEEGKSSDAADKDLENKSPRPFSMSDVCMIEDGGHLSLDAMEDNDVKKKKKKMAPILLLIDDGIEGDDLSDTSTTDKELECNSTT